MLEGYFDIPNFVFFKSGNIWAGSLYKNFSYRIVPIKRKPEEGESELHVLVWYGTECIDKVKEFKAEFHEEYSPEGLIACREKLTEEADKFKAVRKELGF